MSTATIEYGTVVEITRGRLKGTRGVVITDNGEPFNDFTVSYVGASKVAYTELFRRGSLRPTGAAQTAWALRMARRVYDGSNDGTGSWVDVENEIVLTPFCDKVLPGCPRQIKAQVRAWIDRYELTVHEESYGLNPAPRFGYTGYHWHGAGFGTHVSIFASRVETPVL